MSQAAAVRRQTSVAPGAVSRVDRIRTGLMPLAASCSSQLYELDEMAFRFQLWCMEVSHGIPENQARRAVYIRK